MPMVDDQMWQPIPTHPCGCVRGTSATCAVHAGGPGVFDVVRATGWRPTDPPHGEIRLTPEVEARMVEAIARRVAELLKAG